MAELPVVMELPGVGARIEAALQQFQQHQADQPFLTRCLALIGQVEEWKYSTGPLYDLPPYQMQLMGFSGGKPLKKSFADLSAARAGGAYASGFVGGRHVLTVDPAENLKLSPQVTQYDHEGDLARATITRQPALAVPVLSRPASLVGLGETSWLDERRRLHIAVGSRGAFAVYLYRYDDAQRPRHVHLFSKGHTVQSDYELHYDDAGNLSRVTDVLGHPVWPKR